ncbi:porin [Planctomyces sp. SH-PL62]|uniref:porin n=1 Tax=Planctomyces sp. SH-PL62 TaxID=1636152 RepID=UPI00078CD783|nr:porin [Planctomyces sp. SH-PL62]AMV37769.1 Phosphate-selective porin O and P [Planctomyces sp. SH-PL62]
MRRSYAGERRGIRRLGWALVLGVLGVASAYGQSPSVEDRLRSLEDANRALLEQNRLLMERLGEVSEKYGQVDEQLRSLNKQLDQAVVRTAQEQPPRSDVSDEGGAGARDNPAEGPAGGTIDLGGTAGDQPPRSSRSDEGGAGARDNPAQLVNPRTPGGVTRIPFRVNFGPGVEFETENEEYQFQIHNQTQVEGRFYTQTDQTAAGGFDVPRQRFIIAGRLSKPIEYDASLESSYGTVNLLNAFVNFHYDDRLMVKFGRFKVPYLYEYYAISNADLLQPERSVFGANFGLNRGAGAQAWGQLFAKRLDYAVGLFDGPRNQQLDFNAAKDVIAYANYRPFQENPDLPALKYFNVGGSVAFGNQNNPLYPMAMRTSVGGTNNPGAFNAAPSFFEWNPNVVERGDRALWGAHLAYFYKSLSLIGEWQSGFASYAVANRTGARPGRVPLGGFYVAGGYFLTGEEVNRRSQVRPKKPFDLRRKSFGLGAFELETRYSVLTMGEEVFTQGFADPNLWTNRAQTVDLGLNWYLNEYVKIYLDWQHAEFGQPVLYAPGKFQKNSDLFWIRGQIYF